MEKPKTRVNLLAFCLFTFLTHQSCFKLILISYVVKLVIWKKINNIFTMSCECRREKKSHMNLKLLSYVFTYDFNNNWLNKRVITTSHRNIFIQLFIFFSIALSTFFSLSKIEDTIKNHHRKLNGKSFLKLHLFHFFLTLQESRKCNKIL